MIRAEYNRGSEREEGASWACGRSGLEEQRCLTSTRLGVREANSFQEKGRAEQLPGCPWCERRHISRAGRCEKPERLRCPA